MKRLIKPARAGLALLTAILVSACGGGATPTAVFHVPAPSRMASTVSGDTEIAMHLYQALYGKAPGHEQLKSMTAQIAANGAGTWANAMASEQVGLSNTEFAAQVLFHIGATHKNLTGTPTFGEPLQAYFGLLGGFVQYLDLVGPANRGVVAAQLTKIISNLEVDSQFGVYAVAATALNKQITANYAYSLDPKNTAAAVVPTP